jgi:N-acetylneuraminic acid mutarotase
MCRMKIPRLFSVRAAAAAALALVALVGCGLRGPFAFLVNGVPHQLTVVTVNEVYDPTSAPAGQSPWAPADPLPVAFFVETATVADDKIYTAAGGTDTAFRFDPAAAPGAQWQTLPNLSQSRVGAVAVAVSATVVVVSGTGPMGPIAELEQLDGSVPSPTAWVQVSLPFARTDMAAVAAEGKIYFFGGDDVNRTASADAWVYDPQQRTVAAIAPMSTPRVAPGAFVAGGRIHVVGGQAQNGLLLPSEDVFDIASTTMTAAPLPVPDTWFDPQTVVIGDDVLVMSSRTRNVFRSRNVDRFTISTNTWTNDPAIPTVLSGAALASNRGSGITAGGFDGSLSTRDVFVLDFAAPPLQWVGAFTMPTKRHGAFAAEINGKTYVIGGVQRKETTQSSSFF